MLTVMFALAIQETESKIDVKVDLVAVAVQRIDDPENRPLMMNSTTTAVVKLTAGDWRLIEMDNSKCRLKLFKDDKGTDLLDHKPEWDDFIGSFPQFGKDNASCTVTLSSGTRPAAGARTIAAEGKLVMTLARGQEDHKSDAIEAKEGTEFELAGLPCEVASAKKSEWTEGKYEVSIVIKKDASRVASARLLDASGNPVEFTEGGGWSGMGQRNITFLVDAEVKQCRIGVTLWKETKTVDVPLKLEFGLGF